MLINMFLITYNYIAAAISLSCVCVACVLYMCCVCACVVCYKRVMCVCVHSRPCVLCACVCCMRVLCLYVCVSTHVRTVCARAGR